MPGFIAQGANTDSRPPSGRACARRALLHRFAAAALLVALAAGIAWFSLSPFPAPNAHEFQAGSPVLKGEHTASAPGVLSHPENGPRAASQPSSPHVSRDSAGKLAWPRPRNQERQAERDRMVDTQIARGDPFRTAVGNARVLEAMRAVPRHEFVPEHRRSSAYADTPLPIGHGQTISQPYIVALMTELLEVEPGDKVLEIGTGSGYQAAVLSELTPWVYSIEIIEALHRDAAARLERLGYKTIQTRAADGYDGWAEQALFDGIIVTCAAGHVPPPLWDQLAPSGRMVVPIGGPFDVQRLVVLTKLPDGSRQSRTVIPVAFVPMTGRIESP